MKRTTTLALTGLLFVGFLPMASVAHAGDVGSGSVEWTFYNDGSGSPCSSFSGGPALTYGGYGSGVEAPSGCNADYWSGHGEGYFVSPVNGTVEFCGVADDFIDITINGDMVVENAGQGGACADYDLTLGVCYSLTLDYTEVFGYASFFIAWDAYGSSDPMTTSDLIDGPCPTYGGEEFRGFNFKYPKTPANEAKPTQLPTTL